MSVKIIVDSSADIPESLKDKFDIVHLSLSFGEKTYIDGVTIDRNTFYNKLVSNDVLPITSQATPDQWDQAFKKATENGDSVVAITLSSTLSGTYQSATIAASDYEGKVFVVDSSTVAIGTAILAEYALNLVEQGFDAKTIAEHIEKKKNKVLIVAYLDTLEYLKKGGRISKTVAFAGGLLNLKPVINVEKGNINTIGKARGIKQANTMLIEEIEKAGIDLEKPVLLGYTGNDEDALLNFREESKKLYKTTPAYEQIGSIIGTHAGPGAVAAAFFSK